MPEDNHSKAIMSQRENIVVTARTRFKEYGIRSVSVDDICKELGMSKKTFYQYFPGKDELVQAVLNDIVDSIESQAVQYMSGKSALECVRILSNMHEKVGDVHKQPPFNYDLQKYYPVLYKKYMRDVHESTKRILCKHLQQGVDEGIYRADLDVEICAVMYSLIQQAFIRNQEEIQGVSPKRLIRFTMDSFLRSILSEDGKMKLVES